MFNNSTLSNNLKFVDHVKNKAEPLLSKDEELLFTDNSMTHSFQLIEILENILQDMQFKLTEDELTILIAAMYLHDVGLFIGEDLYKYPDLYSDLQTIRFKQILNTNELSLEDIKLNKAFKLFCLIECHHKLSSYMIENLLSDYFNIGEYSYIKELLLVI